jgi:enamine deaminase RidA (YjgF/YER057c/UK114 family)
MAKIPIRPDSVRVLGVYTPAFKVSDGDLIIMSGVVGVDSDGNTVGVGDAAAQTRQALANLKATLEAAGATLDDVIHVRVFSTDLRNRPAINAERRKVFKDPMPASTHVQVTRLVGDDWLLEIEATAFVPRRP